MNKENFHELAQGLLKQQQALSRQLLDLLTQEYKTLCTHQAESLAKITLGKQPLIIELNKLNQQWLTLLAANQGDMPAEEIGNFLKDYDQNNTRSLFALWKNLQHLAKDCQKANTINGSVIALRHQATQQTMAILRGQIPGNTVYDTHGNNAAGYTGGSALAKA